MRRGSRIKDRMYTRKGELRVSQPPKTGDLGSKSHAVKQAVKVEKKK